MSKQYVQSQQKAARQKQQRAAKQKRDAEAARKAKKAKQAKERERAKTKKAKLKQARGKGAQKDAAPIKLIDDARLLKLEGKRKSSKYLELPAPYEVLGCGENGEMLGDYLFILTTCVTLREEVENLAFFRLCDLKAAVGSSIGTNPCLLYTSPSPRDRG